MTASLTYNLRSGIEPYSPSQATSIEASTVFDRIRGWLEEVGKAQSLHAQSLDELADTFLDCREADWDGYDAMAVEDCSYLRAEFLLRKLLGRFPAPSIGGSPHGSLTLEWMKSPRRRVMTSINGDDQIAYAAIFGDETAQGVAGFVGDIPRELVELLSRLYYAR